MRFQLTLVWSTSLRSRELMPTRELRLGEPREGCRAEAAEPRRRALHCGPTRAQLQARHSPRSNGRDSHGVTSPPLRKLRPPRVPRSRSGLLGGFWFRHEACLEKGIQAFRLRSKKFGSRFAFLCRTYVRCERPIGRPQCGSLSPHRFSPTMARSRHRVRGRGERYQV